MVRCAYHAGPRRRARCGDMVEHAQPQCGTAATPRKRTRTRRQHDVSSFLVMFGLLVVFRYLSFFLHQAPRQLAEALGREREPGCETPPASRKNTRKYTPHTKGFAGSLDGCRSPPRVMPKMLEALWRRVGVRRNARG